jgi:hypothetical protein
MAKSYDINNPPPGGFEKGAWYWDPKAGQARRWSGSRFGNPGEAIAVDGEGGGSQQPQASSQPQPTSPLQAVNQTIEDSFKKLQDEVRQKWGDYTAGNPFKVDDVLAAKTKEASEQIDPYYNELLGDYLTGVQRKVSRGVDDTRDLVSELSASTAAYSEQTQLNLDSALESAEKGFIDSGLIGSGDHLRTEGRLMQSTNSELSDYMRKADYQKKQLETGLSRNLEDINLSKKGYVSDLERNRFTDVQNRAGQLTKETGQQYIRGFEQTLPTELQSASGFDMLRSLGIYS